MRPSHGSRALVALLAAALALPAAAPASAQEAPGPTPSPSPTPSPVPAGPPLVKTDQALPQRGYDDKRRTMRSYPSNLLYNTLGVVTRGNYGPIAAMFAAVPAAMTLDDDCIEYFAEHDYETFADVGATLGGTVVVAGLTVGFFSAGRIVRGGRFRAGTYDLSQAILVNGIYTFSLKYVVSRERPDASDQLSFPSGHTSNAFAAATVVHRHYGYKVGIPAYAWPPSSASRGWPPTATTSATSWAGPSSATASGARWCAATAGRPHRPGGRRRPFPTIRASRSSPTPVPPETASACGSRSSSSVR